MSLQILLTLSLINRWDVMTSTISSALLQEPMVSEEPLLIQPPPELEQSPGVLWRLTRGGIEHSPRLWQHCLANKLEEHGLKRNKVEPCIFSSEQLSVMLHLDTLLIGGDKHQQESFINKLSAFVSLTDTNKLDAHTPLSFLNKTLAYNHPEHSISVHVPTSSYMKLFKMYDMEKAQPTNTLEDQLCPSTGQRRLRKPLASARQKLYRTAVGQLLWATPARPDISLAVKELSRSLEAPTQQDEQQLKQVLRYIKGSLHFTTSLQPPRKRVIDRASSLRVKAYFDSTLEGSSQLKQLTSGATLSLWGVPLAAFSRTQASSASSSAEAELCAMGMAVQSSLHLKSLLQEMQLSQLSHLSFQSSQTAPVARL